MLIEDIALTKVAIVDDIEQEVLSIRNYFDHHNIEYEYFKVDLTGEGPSYKKMRGVQLVFLDLYYNHAMNAGFDPYQCAEIIKKIIPVNHQYYLVIWTKDTQHAEELMDVLREYNEVPVAYVAKKKDDFRIGNNDYQVEKLLKEVEAAFNEVVTVQEFYGQIVAIEDAGVLVNCLIHKETSTFEVRRFDISIMENYIPLEKGTFLKILVITKPGSRTIELSNSNNKELMSRLFVKPDDFEDIGDISFLSGK